MNADRIVDIFYREAKRLGKKGQPNYYLGYQAAMESIVAASNPRPADPCFLRALQMESLAKTGIAMPAPVFGRNKRGKEVILRLRETASDGQLSAIKAEIARKEAFRNRPPVIVVPYGVAETKQAATLKRRSNLTSTELARRAAVISQAA